MNDNQLAGVKATQNQPEDFERKVEAISAEFTDDLRAALDQFQLENPFAHGTPAEAEAVVRDCWDRLTEKHQLRRDLTVLTGTGSSDSVGILDYDITIYDHSNRYLPYRELPQEFSRRIVEDNVRLAVRKACSEK